MVHARLSETYIRFTIIYKSDHIFPVLTINDFRNKEGNPTTPFKLVTGIKPSISNSRVLCCPCFARKANVDVGTEVLYMRHL